MALAEVVEVGKRYTMVKFLANVYHMGRIKYLSGEEYLIPNHEVEMYTYKGEDRRESNR